MFNCAWCKEERDKPALYSKEQEPICAHCVGKYRYALEIGVAKGKLSDLTKEERRKVSKELSGINDIETFHSAMITVHKQELFGIVKVAAYIIGTILFIFFVFVFIKLTAYFGERNWLGYLISVGIGFYLIMLITRLSWLFKLWQMVRKMQKGGYKV